MESIPAQIPSVHGSSGGNRVAIIGASGYGGLQTLRLLREHPFFKISFLGGETSAGQHWSEICSFLPLDDDPLVQDIDFEKISESSDFAVLSLPNGLASQIVPELIKRNVRIVDLSADYRFRSLSKWSQTYVHEAQKYRRSDHELCKEAIYGLPEWNQKSISKADLIASPGCFPTASLLALLPFLNQGLIENDGLIIDAKTGTSGGGRNAGQKLLLSEASESIAPYGVIGHRHTPEIEQEASEIAGREIQLQFTPHLVPMVRGLLVTVYGRLRDPGLTAEDCTTVLNAVYRNSCFVDVLPVGTYPSTKWVRSTNKAMISVQVDTRNGRLVIMCSIDNLMKGQASQAIQSLNLMSGQQQETGLPLLTFYP